MRIITHKGQAHRDEFIACCLLIASHDFECIERRDPTDHESDGDIILDQGGGQFDHHQTRDVRCAITCVAEHLNLDTKWWTWLKFTEILDSQGPKAASEYLGTDKLIETVSPIETTVLRWFESEECLVPEDALWDLMYRIGTEKLDYLDDMEHAMKRHDELCTIDTHDGLTIVHNAARSNVQLGFEAWIQENCPEAAITVSYDDTRDIGDVVLFRRNDHPRVDFSKLADLQGVRFAHKGGFIAKILPGYDYKYFLLEAIT